MGGRSSQPSFADEWDEDSSNLVTRRYLPPPDRISSIPPASFSSQEVHDNSATNWGGWRLFLGGLGALGLGLWFGATAWADEESEKETPLVLDGDLFVPAQVESPQVEVPEGEDVPEELTSDPAPVASITSEAVRSDSASAETALERARRGEAEALEALEQKPADERSFEEIVALSEGRVQRQRDLAWAAAILFASQDFERGSTEQVQMILAVVGDPRTFREGLLSLARIRNPIGADLIYQASKKYSHRPEVVEMAYDLLGTRDVIAQASPELSVVIDAIFINECRGVRDLLERALTYADRRAVPHLARFAERTGCGAARHEDCFSCLRDDDLLERALEAAKDRRAPLWK